MAASHDRLLQALTDFEDRGVKPTQKELCKAAKVSRATLNRDRVVIAKLASLAPSPPVAPAARRAVQQTKETSRLLRTSIDAWANAYQVVALHNAALQEEVVRLRQGTTPTKVLPFAKPRIEIIRNPTSREHEDDETI